MKSYTLVLPFLMIPIFIVCSGVVRPAIRPFCIMIPMWIGIVGLQSLSRFAIDSKYFDASYTRLADLTDEQKKLIEARGLLTPGSISLRENGLAMFMSYNWLQSPGRLNFREHQKDSIAIMLPRDQSNCFGKVAVEQASHLIYESRNLIIFDIPARIDDLVSLSKTSIDPRSYDKYWKICEE